MTINQLRELIAKERFDELDRVDVVTTVDGARYHIEDVRFNKDSGEVEVIAATFEPVEAKEGID